MGHCQHLVWTKKLRSLPGAFGIDNMNSKIKKTHSVTLSVFTILVSGFFLFFLLQEWFTVDALNSDYPFGAEGPLPDYYSSASSYLRHVLIFAMLFLTTFGAALVGLIKDKRALAVFAFMAMTVLLAVMLFSATGDEPITNLSSQLRGGYRGRGSYLVPHDSTIGVPNFVFIGTWILIILFLVRLAWEYRDKIFIKNDDAGKLGKTNGRRKK